MLENVNFTKDLRKGERIEGRDPIIAQLDFLTGTVLYSSDYKYSEPGRDGMYRIDRNEISKDVKQESLKMSRFLPDAQKVIETSARLIQLNQNMQDAIAETGGTEKFSLIQGVRVFNTYAKPLLDIFSTEEERQTIKKSGKLGEFFTDAKIINEGVTNPKLHEIIRKSIDAADARIGSIEGEFKNGIIQAEVEYAHLKVLLTFTLAKLIQGGTGGRGVSNQDFDAVAKSIRDGTLTTLPTEIIALRGVLNNAKREYVYLYLRRFPALYNDPSQANRMQEKVMNLHGALQRQHTQRRMLNISDSASGDSSGDDVNLNVDKTQNTDASSYSTENPIHKDAHTARTRAGR